MFKRLYNSIKISLKANINVLILAIFISPMLPSISFVFFIIWLDYFIRNTWYNY